MMRVITVKLVEPNLVDPRWGWYGLIRNDDGTTFEIGDFVGTIELNINRAVEIVNFHVFQQQFYSKMSEAMSDDFIVGKTVGSISYQSELERYRDVVARAVAMILAVADSVARKGGGLVCIKPEFLDVLLATLEIVK